MLSDGSKKKFWVDQRSWKVEKKYFGIICAVGRTQKKYFGQQQLIRLPTPKSGGL